MRTRRSIQLLAALLAVGALVSACGSSDSDSGSADSSGVEGAIEGELLPFSLVQDNEFVFEGDPSDPGRGIFRVRTTEPMICTIVWGETDEFGNFNNSLAMNGTGIIDHDVILPGAEAGKTYSFRVQGSTADGNQYRSEIGTFTIPEVESGGEADEMAVHGANLALGATITDFSSIFGPGWEAENAIDDDTNTEWATAGDGDSGFIVLDLGSTQDVVGVDSTSRPRPAATSALSKCGSSLPPTADLRVARTVSIDTTRKNGTEDGKPIRKCQVRRMDGQPSGAYRPHRHRCSARRGWCARRRRRRRHRRPGRSRAGWPRNVEPLHHLQGDRAPFKGQDATDLVKS